MSKKTIVQKERYIKNRIIFNPKKEGDTIRLTLYSGKPVVIQQGEEFQFNAISGDDCFTIETTTQYDRISGKPKVVSREYTTLKFDDVEVYYSIDSNNQGYNSRRL